MTISEFFITLAGIVAASLALVALLDLFFEDEIEDLMAKFSRLWGNK